MSLSQVTASASASDQAISTAAPPRRDLRPALRLPLLCALAGCQRFAATLLSSLLVLCVSEQHGDSAAEALRMLLTAVHGLVKPSMQVLLKGLRNNAELRRESAHAWLHRAANLGCALAPLAARALQARWGSLAPALPALLHAYFFASLAGFLLAGLFAVRRRRRSRR